MKRTLWLCAGVLLAPVTTGQQTSEGLFLGASMSVFVDGGTVDALGPMSPGALYTKSVGYQPLVGEVPPAGPTLPDFRASTLFGGGSEPAFVVDALSTGQDPVAATSPAGGVSSVLLPADAWGQITFSVSRDSQGLLGSVLRDEANQPDGAGAALFTYMLPGSESAFPSIADCYPSDRSQRALDSTEMGLADTSAGEIVAMDFVMTLYRAGDPVLDELPENPTVYFSVSRESVFPPGGGPGTVPANWFGGPGNRSGASILSTTWVGAAWTTPTVFLNYDQLGLDQFDDLDALAVDELNCKAIFSVTRDSAASVDEQLQVVDWCLEGSPATGTYQTSTQAVARAAEVDPDDEIDAVCGEDPGGQTAIDYGIILGLPVGKVLQPKFLACSAFRDVAAPDPTLTFVVENLPTGGPSRPLWFLAGSPGPTLDGFLPIPGLVPVPVASVGGGITDTHHEFSIESPSLAVLLDFPVAVFFGVAGGGEPKVVSPKLVLTL